MAVERNTVNAKFVHFGANNMCEKSFVSIETFYHAVVTRLLRCGIAIAIIMQLALIYLMNPDKGGNIALEGHKYTSLTPFFGLNLPHWPCGFCYFESLW